MAKKQSPLAVKRGPRRHRLETLVKLAKGKIEKRRKARHRLPSTRMWPGQVKAGVDALFKHLHFEYSATNKAAIYTKEFEDVVRAVFKACVQARVKRAMVLRRRADKRKVKDASP